MEFLAAADQGIQAMLDILHDDELLGAVRRAEKDRMNWGGRGRCQEPYPAKNCPEGSASIADGDGRTVGGLDREGFRAVGRVAASLAQALGWSGVVVDERGEAVVWLGSSPPSCAGVDWVLSSTTVAAIERPAEHPACRQCRSFGGRGLGGLEQVARGACPRSTEVLVPIWGRGKLRGVVALGDWESAPGGAMSESDASGSVVPCGAGASELGGRLALAGASALARLLEMVCRYAWEAAAREQGPSGVTGGVTSAAKEYGQAGSRGGSVTFDDIKGSSAALQEVKEKAMLAARADSTILILGETGAGKEMFARAIHVASHRAQGPFVAINCAAIPETLLESELFGYEAGAFTGARSTGKRGKFELAMGGTLFLDEVADMPLAVQSKLLRVLESKEFDRVGGVRSVKMDVRIIAATHKPLECLVKEGKFRDDLYYRLNVIPLHIPPLRERKEDIYILLEHLFRKHHRAGNRPKRLSAEALDYLFRYDWPGNVRELENVVEYVLSLERSDVVPLSGLPPRLVEAVMAGRTATGDTGEMVAGTAVAGPLQELEEKAILAALRQYGGRPGGKDQVARTLGIHRSTLYRKMKKLGIAP